MIRLLDVNLFASGGVAGTVKSFSSTSSPLVLHRAQAMKLKSHPRTMQSILPPQHGAQPFFHPSTKQAPLPAIQLIRLPPQGIRLELAKRRLDPPPRSGIRGDGPRRRRRTDQQTRLPTQEDTGDGEEGVGDDIAGGSWLEKWSDIWDFLCGVNHGRGEGMVSCSELYINLGSW
ncbi:hypothetical protein GJ744_004291 [Endocarpon pusillum]|uniref:Uncharacterized protein n=1 Tax=Endocarpon pusillum TaxID=364733 RepID=A0A8H7A8Y9_9EURO|nr:hypothetical protein GJ744_004291 [Endocarpon pusillum]